MSRILYIMLLTVFMSAACNNNDPVPPADIPEPEERPEIEGMYLGGDISVLQCYVDK